MPLTQSMIYWLRNNSEKLFSLLKIWTQESRVRSTNTTYVPPPLQQKLPASMHLLKVQGKYWRALRFEPLTWLYFFYPAALLVKLVCLRRRPTAIHRHFAVAETIKKLVLVHRVHDTCVGLLLMSSTPGANARSGFRQTTKALVSLTCSR